MDDFPFDILRLAGQGFCCAQIPVQLILETHGRENSALTRTLSALCHGFPDTSGPCGALLGGACLLGYFAGKGSAATEADERLPLMQSELGEWFREQCRGRFAGINCVDITGDGQPDQEVCGNLIIQTHAKVLELLLENGYDPQEDPALG